MVCEIQQLDAKHKTTPCMLLNLNLRCHIFHQLLNALLGFTNLFINSNIAQHTISQGI